MKKLILAVFVFLLLPLRADAQSCYGMQISPPPYGTVCGTVSKPGWLYPNAVYNVKFCRPGDPSNCKATSTFHWQPQYSGPVQAYTFYAWGGSSSTYYDWDIFVWNDAAYSGSSSIPINRVWLNGWGGSGLNLIAPPRPLPPTPVYPPNGGTNIPNSYTVVWNSGIDAERAQFPATWEIWFKYWLPGEQEPAQYSLARDNMPCHDNGSGPDAQGRCSTFVAGPQPAGNWRWKVVAKLDVSSWVNAQMGQTIFSTESSSAYFIGQ